AITGLILANILLIIWVDVLHIPKLFGPIINLIITIPLNFMINKLWAFKDTKRIDEE
ncbi:polysaccharide biosynthesis protein GtrA, partial [Lachnotalea glycerini]